MNFSSLKYLMALLVLIAASCGSDGVDSAGDDVGEASEVEVDDTDDEAMEDEEAMEDDVEAAVGIALEFDGLEPLGADSVYEGWLIIDGAPSSTGRFNVDESGVAVADGEQAAPVADAASASAVVITIEPADDPDPGPAETHVLAGDVSDGSADLTVGHPAALGTDFVEADSVYVLATPTTDDTSDELSGVWFIGLDGGATQGLQLAALPSGWIYEGWVVVDGTPVSTGRFADPAAADAAATFSGPDGTGPNFPGEDLIVNPPDGLTFPLDLRGATVVVSVEPEPDDGPAPFAIKPLSHIVPDGIGDHEIQTFEAGPASPTGVALIEG